MKNRLLWLALCLMLLGCGKGVSEYEAGWYDTAEEVNPDFVDVFYISSTEILSSKDADGNTVYYAPLNPDERGLLDQESRYIHANMFADSVNFFSPYYHQMTMDAFMLPAQQRESLVPAVEKEMLEAFRYYMSELNGGRKYILAGFSQGAMLVKSLLKNMTDKEYSSMVAAYIIGEEITSEDLACPRIVPAQGAFDKSVSISFNSVVDPADMWDLVTTDPAACINPVNWTTSCSPATLDIDGAECTVAIDPDNNVLVVGGLDPQSYSTTAFPAPWPEGCLHGKEIIYYASSLGQNAKDRAYR